MNFTNGLPLNTPTVHPDRRNNARFTVQIPVDLCRENSDASQRLETIDLSRGGCYVHLIQTLALATYVQVTLWLDSNPVKIRGRVVSRHPQFGNGIMFLDLEGTRDQLLTRYLNAIKV